MMKNILLKILFLLLIPAVNLFAKSTEARVIKHKNCDLYYSTDTYHSTSSLYIYNGVYISESDRYNYDKQKINQAAALFLETASPILEAKGYNLKFAGDENLPDVYRDTPTSKNHADIFNDFLTLGVVSDLNAHTKVGYLGGVETEGLGEINRVEISRYKAAGIVNRKWKRQSLANLCHQNLISNRHLAIKNCNADSADIIELTSKLPKCVKN